MPKPPLREPFKTLETKLIQTLLDGLHEWRPDLSYPESHSDMDACVRRLMRTYILLERPSVVPDLNIVSDE
jgi:hypothetical protein